jgi:hypothetical protein
MQLASRIRSLAIAAVFLLTSVSAVASTNTYTHNITGTTSSLTIYQANHGFTSTRLAVHVYDHNGVRQSTSAYSFSVDGTTKDVSLTFSPSLQNGAAVKLTGTFSGSNTTASTDFRVSYDSPGSSVKVCSPCADNAFAQRGYNSKVYVELTPVTFSGNCASSGSCTLYVYIDDNKIKFGIASGGSGSCSGSNCAIAAGVTSYPGGVIQLGRVSFVSGIGWTGVTDDRPVSFQ